MKLKEQYIIYLFNGISLFLSKQFKNTLTLQFKDCRSVFKIGPNFCAPRDTGSTIAIKVNATSSEFVAGTFMALDIQSEC